MEHLIKCMEKSALFSGIRPEDYKPMLHCVGYRTVHYKKGEIIFPEDERVQHIGVILTGAVDMVKEDLWGGKTIMTRMQPGALFGESFACGADSVATVCFTAAEESEILFMPFGKIMRSCSIACEFHHRLLENMVRLIAGKNRDLMHKIDVVSRKTLKEKIMAYLSAQSQAADSRYFEIPLGRSELADYLCADRSALTRVLSEMKCEGLIDYDRNTFRIL